MSEIFEANYELVIEGTNRLGLQVGSGCGRYCHLVLISDVVGKKVEVRVIEKSELFGEMERGRVGFI
jgi:hypothetical protein